MVRAWVHCTLPTSPLLRLSQGCCSVFVFLCVSAENILTWTSTISFTVIQQGVIWQACHAMLCHAPLSRVQGPPQQAVMVWSLQHALTLCSETQLRNQCKAGYQQPTCTCCLLCCHWDPRSDGASQTPADAHQAIYQSQKRPGGIQGDIKGQGSHVP